MISGVQHRQPNAVWAFAYLALTIIFHTGLLWLISRAVISSSVGLLSIFWSVIISLIVAERMALTVLFSVTRSPSIPPRLEDLPTRPRVALLYCTCDDALEECLNSLRSQEYENLAIFVLDDSLSEHSRELINSTGYTIVRRADRNGYKAGNLNNWLKTWGKKFDYFVIVDADSMLPPDFVRRMLLYAEHPANQGIAIFESRIMAWRPRTLFQRVLASGLAMANVMSLRLSNRLGITLSYGHNNLCRVSPLLAIGGFEEKYIGEDHATTLTLLAKGWGCQVVDVESFEGMPVNLEALNKRTYRWTRNDLQLLAHPWTKAPLALQFKLLIKSLTHCFWVAIVFQMMALIWSQHTTFADLIHWIDKLFLMLMAKNPQVISVLVAFFVYCLYLYFLSLPQAIVSRLSFREYVLSTFIGACLGLGTMFAVLKGTIHSLVRVPFHFHTTPKREPTANWACFLGAHWPFCGFAIIAMIGLLVNPVCLILNWPWILPLVMGPLLLYLSERRANISLQPTAPSAARFARRLGRSG